MVRILPYVLALLLLAAGVGEASDTVALVGGNYLPVTSEPVSGWSLIIRDGRIAAFGPDVVVPDEARRVDVGDRFVMPGSVDIHSHMGVYPWPSSPAHEDGNEMTDPTTPQVRAEDAFHIDDPALQLALAGGATTAQILPGSGNLIGGQSVVLKIKPGRKLEDVKIRDANPGMKMALGENPKRVYGERNQSPATRMGNFAVLRQTFIEAQEYSASWDRYEKRVEAGDEKAKPPERKLDMEALVEILEGTRHPNIHCYQADEMIRMMDLAEDFGFKVNSFHHAVEAWKIADELARRGVAAAIWPDWWGFKHEAWDALLEAPAVLYNAGALVVLHTDSARDIQRMAHLAAKMARYGLPPAEALKTFTINPAIAMGIDHRVGSLEVGKDADIAIYSGHPFDMYSRVEMTIVDGEILYERE
jgi:imidazolonepropionase-like amidohydrolase